MKYWFSEISCCFVREGAPLIVTETSMVYKPHTIVEYRPARMTIQPTMLYESCVSSNERGFAWMFLRYFGQL